MRRSALPIAVAVALALACVSARAVNRQEGDLIGGFEGGIHPTTLPRDLPAPVAVSVAGGIRSASGNADRLPQLRRITVAINREGVLFDRGLPVCHAEAIRSAREADARRTCRGAIIGKGHVTVQVRIPSQLPFAVRANLVVFNGPRRDGQRLILAQAYARKPPGSFILTFQVGRQAGTYGTVLSTTLPRAARAWAYLTHFDMNLHRVFNYKGQRRSYVSAACAAPVGFEEALFPFARATYSFAGGQRLTLSQVGSCRVAE